MARKTVNKETQKSVLLSSRRRCCICYGLHRDLKVKQGQIAHLDRNAENDDEDNLAFICLEHHDWYDTNPSQSKRATAEEVRHFREELGSALCALPKDEGDPQSFAVMPRKTFDRPDADYPIFLGVGDLPHGETRVFLSETASDMDMALRKLPPLSRSVVADEAYRGRWVAWRGTIMSITEGDSCYMVMVVTIDQQIILLTFPLAWRAEVETLRENDHIHFEGQIRHASGSVELVNPMISEHLRPS